MGIAQGSAPLQHIAQLTAGASDGRLMLTNWWQLDEYNGVLELIWLPCALELHCRVRQGSTVAWWTDAFGRWLGPAHVGRA